jgi:signal transduction histidine kinase
VVLSFNETARRLEESDEQRRRLLADLGHELRTPLTVVRGEVEAMLDGVHPSDPTSWRCCSTDLRALAGDVADAHRRSAGGRDDRSGPDEGGGDHLIINAIRAMPQGGRLALAVKSNGALTSIVVGDTGTGIPAEELNQMFERFQKSPRSPGSGVGPHHQPRSGARPWKDHPTSPAEGVGTEVRVDIPDAGLRTAPPPPR